VSFPLNKIHLEVINQQAGIYNGIIMDRYGFPSANAVPNYNHAGAGVTY